MRSEIDQWNQNAEEADDVNDENDGFNPRQHTDQESIDKQGDDDYGIKQEGAMPPLKDVVWVVQNQKALNNSPPDKGSAGQPSLPGNDTDPAG